MASANLICATGWEPGWFMIDKCRAEADAILRGEFTLIS